MSEPERRRLPASQRVGCLPALLFMLVIPAVVTWILASITIHEGDVGGTQVQQGSAYVTACSPAKRLLGLMQDCTVRDVSLTPTSDGGTSQDFRYDELMSARSLHGNIPVVLTCHPRRFNLASSVCVLYPRSFPRSLWWSWLPYLALPIGIVGYLALRASRDNRRLRRTRTPIPPAEPERDGHA